MRKHFASLAKSRALHDLETIAVGVGATEHVGSDSYPFYVASAQLSPKGKHIVGMYRAGSHFEHDWTEGTMTVDKFDPSRAPDFYITLFRNRWWDCDKDGVRCKPYRQASYCFGSAVSYRDPSF